MDAEFNTSPVPVIHENMESDKPSKDYLVEFIDSIEQKVESLRAQAAYLEDERDGIAIALDSLRNSTVVDALVDEDREDVFVSLDRLSTRISSVEISIRTCRDQLQEEALFEVNNLINRMVVDIETDKVTAKLQCNSFINACMSDPECGPIDKKFENALLGCTLDDQKKIRRRLYGLLNYLEKSTISML